LFRVDDTITTDIMGTPQNDVIFNYVVDDSTFTQKFVFDTDKNQA